MVKKDKEVKSQKGTFDHKSYFRNHQLIDLLEKGELVFFSFKY